MSKYTVEDWQNAFAGYVGYSQELTQLLKEGSPEEFVTKLMQDVQQIDWQWREEIEKYLPQLSVMSFCGAHSTIKWLMKQVDIKPEQKALADKLLTIEQSHMTNDEKSEA